MLAAAPAPDAACVAHSTRERPHLVELYTSEGCSSCPPAERWMSSIRDDATQVGLEFHVVYWDELGWPDPFADAATELPSPGDDRSREPVLLAGHAGGQAQG